MGSGTLEREAIGYHAFRLEWASRFESRPVGLIDDESTDQIEDIAPIPKGVQPEPRRP